MVEFPVEAICSLGVGGAVALIVFLMYRKDRASSEELIRQDRVFMENRLTKIIEQDQKMIERDQITREANTKALTELTTVLERMNGRH